MSRKTFDERSRRRFLSTAAVAAAGVTGMTTVGAAKKSPQEVIAEARDKFDRNEWDADEYRDHLRQNGFNTPNFQGEVKIKKPKKEDDNEISGQKFEQHHFNFDFTLGNNDTYAWPFVTFYVDPSWWRDGEYPVDGISFGWDSSEYDYDNEWWGSDPSDLREYSGRGVAFEYDDAYGTIKEEKENWVQARIRPEGGTKSSRNVIFSYLHTWNSTTVENLSVGTDGVISITLSNEDKKWDSPVQEQLSEADQ